MSTVSPVDLAGRHDALSAAVGWIEALLTGSLATTFAILAIAGVGLGLLLGELTIRKGIRVVIGCFILFGAPLIAQGLMNLVYDTKVAPTASQIPRTAPALSGISKPAQYDPYAGASMPDQ